MSYNGHNQRRFVRAQFPCKIVLRAPRAHAISTHTENVGAGGVRVMIAEKLSVGILVDIELYLDQDTITAEGRVVWMLERQNLSRYDTGIEFYRIDEADRKVIDIFVNALITNDDARKS